MELFGLLRWSLVLAALWAAGLPLGKRLFPRFPSAGGALGLPLALAVVSLPAYWIGKVDATAGFVAGALALFVLAGLSYRAGARPTVGGLGAPVIVFAVAFAAMLLVRLGYPRITPVGGEQFLDFSLLKAVLRADAFPPEDPWFAGKQVRYYYGGYLVSGFLTQLAGVEVRYAYNLLLPTFYAALATGAYGLAAAVAERSGHPSVGAGLLAAFLTAAAGNLATPARFLLGLLPDALAREYGRAAITGIRAPYEGAFAQATDPGSWSYWLARYVIPGTPDVFPAWTFVNGDLRPHMVSAPFLVLGAALAFAYYRTPSHELRRRRVLCFGALPALAGLLGVVNTWTLPIVVGLVFLAVAFADADPRSLFGVPEGYLPRVDAVPRVVRREAGRVLAGGAAALLVGAVAFVWVAPYLLFHTAASDGVGFLPPGSQFAPFLLVHGGFLALFALLLWGQSRNALRELGRARAVAALAALGLGAAALAAAGFAPVAVLAVFGLAAWVVGRRERGFAAVLVLAGVGLLIVAEFAYAEVWPHDPDAVRWNTAYKLFHSVWVLWGVAGGVAAAAALSKAIRGISVRRGRALARPAAVLFVVIAVVGGMAVFPAFAGSGRAGAALSGGTTLDGLGHVNNSHPDAGPAIAWLDNREGTPTIASAPGENIYQWVNAPSSLTGVPTVAGWVHEQGYRGEDTYENRVRDVELLYESSPNATLELAATYGVDYVYVGPNERERYELGSFGAHERIVPVFEKGEVTIYEIKPRSGPT